MRLFVPASVAAAVVAADSATNLCLERPDLPKCGTSCYNPARAACCGAQVYLYYQWDPATNATAEQQCCTDKHNASYVAFSCNRTASGNGTVGNATRDATIVAPTKLPVVEDENLSGSGSDFDEELGLWGSDADDDDEDAGDDGEDELASLESDIDELGDDDGEGDDEGEVEDEPIVAGANAHTDSGKKHDSNSTTPTMHPTTRSRSTPLPTTSDDSSSSRDSDHDVTESDDDTETDADADADEEAEEVEPDDTDATDEDADEEAEEVEPDDTDASDEDADIEAVDVDDAETDDSAEATDAPLSPKPTAQRAGNQSASHHPDVLNTSAEHEKPWHVPGAALTQTNSTHNNATHNATRTNRTGSNSSDEATIQRPSSATGAIQHCAGLLAVLCIFGSMLV